MLVTRGKLVSTLGNEGMSTEARMVEDEIGIQS